MDRRDFLKASAVASASSLIPNTSANAQRLRPQRITLRNQAPDSVKTRLATRELLSGLRMLKSAPQIDIGGDTSAGGCGAIDAADRAVAIQAIRRVRNCFLRQERRDKRGQ